MHAGNAHRLAGVLAIALAATMAGARSFVAITEWAADAPAQVLARLGVEGCCHASQPSGAACSAWTPITWTG
jgi:hypothetical protein